ncbi:P53 domain containing protein, partial [Asbolus verrucosus]
GEVLGRRVLCVRICSCPKRDREKEEKKKENTGKKRKIEKKVASPSPSTTAVDTRVFPFSVNIVGEENYKRLVHFSRSLMANEIVKQEGRNDAPFRKCLNEINTLNKSD